MESFITQQLQTILQPVLAHIEDIDDKVGKLDVGLGKVNADIGRNVNLIESSNERIGTLQARVIEAENKIAPLTDAMAENDRKTESVSRDVNAMRADVSQTHKRLEDAEHGFLPKLQQDVAQLQEKAMQARRHLEAVAAIVDDHPLKKEVLDLSTLVKSATLERSGIDLSLQRLQQDVDDIHRTMQDINQVAEKNRVHSSALQKGLQDIAAREGQLQHQLNGWKDQWSKLHPEIQVCVKDIGQLKTRTDHHDAAIHSIQQGCLHNSKGVDLLQHSQDGMRVDVQAVSKDLITTQGDMAAIREGLADATTVANSLHASWEEVSSKLRKTTTLIESVDNRNVAVVADLEKMNHVVMDLQREHRKSVNAVQSVSRDLERTKDALTSTRTDLASANSNMESLKGDLGSTKNVLHRLDHGVEFCSAGFSGLQKGFMATGTNIQQRKSVALPTVTTPRPRSSGKVDLGIGEH